MKSSKVNDYMTMDVSFIAPDATLKQAAIKMENYDCGALPVGTKDKVLGIITDRDIVIRAVSKGKDVAHEKVQDYMTLKVFGCNENDALEDAVEKMHRYEVGRLVVKDRHGTVTGIISFGGLLTKQASAEEIAYVIKHTQDIIAA